MCCKGCEKRHVGCHSSCEEYKAFKEEKRKETEAWRSMFNDDSLAYGREAYERSLKKRPRKRSGWRT